MCQWCFIVYMLIFLGKIQTKLDLKKISYVSINQEVYLEEFISKYSHYTVTIHYDTITKDFAEHLLGLIGINREKTVITINKDFKGLRPMRATSIVKSMNLVLLEDLQKFSSFSSIADNFKFEDTVVFIILKNTNLDYLWKLKYLKNAGNVLLFDLSEQNFIHTYSICYFCGNESYHLRKVQSTNGSKILMQDEHLKPNTFINFNQNVFVVGHLNYFPYFICTNSSSYKEVTGNAIAYVCNEGIGLEAELLKEMSIQLNFTYKLINFGDDSAKGFHNVFKNVESGTLDFAIGGITRTRRRAEKASFTAMIDREDYHMFYLYRTYDFNKALSFVYPFECIIWITTVVLIFGLGTLLCCYGYVMRLRGLEEIHMRWFEYCSLFYKSILEESVHLRSIAFSRKNWFRILWIFWCFYCTLTVCFYKSKMASILARPDHSEPNLMKDILDQGYDLVIESSGSENVMGILENNDILTMRIKSHLIFRTNWCNASRYILENPAAMIIPFDLIQYNLQWQCEELFGPNRMFKGYNQNDLRISRNYLISMPLGWPLGRRVPYRASFNRILATCKQAGLLKKWLADVILSVPYLKKYKIRYAKDNRPIDSANKRMRIDDYCSAFFFLATGNLLAIICFILEILIFKFYKKKSYLN